MYRKNQVKINLLNADRYTELHITSSGCRQNTTTIVMATNVNSSA